MFNDFKLLSVKNYIQTLLSNYKRQLKITMPLFLLNC